MAWAAPLRLVPGGLRSQSRAPARLRAALARRAARDCDVLVATYEELTAFGLEDLAGKTSIVLDLAGAPGSWATGASTSWSTSPPSPST